MKKYLLVLVSLCCALLPALAEHPEYPELKKSDANIIGHVLDKKTSEHLPYITIALKGTTIGTVTDATGHYFLKNLPEGNFMMEVSSVGYKTVTRSVTLKKGKTLEENFELEEDAIALDGVVVSANRSETTRRLAPTLVNVVDLKLFETTNSSTLSQGLNFQPGVRVETNCQNCGFQQVRINGLDGPYTQILIDSRCFMIAYAGCAWVLAKPRRSDVLCLGLLVLGTATAFCDLLVTPIITLGLPLTCWLLEPQQRLRGGVPQCALAVGGSLCWGTGYALCWAGKWALAGAVTNNNVLADALHQAEVRTTADTWHGMELTWRNIFIFLYDTLNSRHLFWPALAVLAVLIALFILSIRSKTALVRALPLALTTCMTPAWFVLLRTHSIQHGWFTWRALGLTVFAGLAFLYYACDLRAARRRLQKGSI